MNYPPTSKYFLDNETPSRPWTPSQQTEVDDDWRDSTMKPYLSSNESTSHFPIQKDASPEPSKERLSPKRLWSLVIPDSVPCRLYISVIVLQTIIDLAVEGALVLKFGDASKTDESLREPSARRLPVYFSIFGFAHVFQFVLAIDAVWMRNTLQFFFLTAFNAILLIYAIVQIFEVRQTLANAESAIFDIPIKILVVILPVVIAFCELAYVVLGWSIWREFGWKVYKLLGADRRIKRLYVHYQILACLMKFDVFFWCGFSIQLIWMVLNSENVEYYITVATLPASLVVLLAGHLGARYENKVLMYAFMISCAGACGYFTFKLFRIISHKDDSNINPVFKTLTAFAALAITFLITTFVWSCIVLSNFGTGLKTHLSRSKAENAQPIRRGSTFNFDSAQPETEYCPNKKSNRMSLD